MTPNHNQRDLSLTAGAHASIATKAAETELVYPLTLEFEAKANRRYRITVMRPPKQPGGCLLVEEIED